MRRYRVLVLALAFPICAVTGFRINAAPATQAQEYKSDFDECAAMLIEFTQKHPNPTLTERIEGYYLVAQCQEKLGQREDAIFSYAKAATAGEELAESVTARKARERLERLYKYLHNDTLLGIDKVYKRAKESLAEPEE